MRKSSIVLAISILLIFSIISIVDAKDISFESSSDSKEAEKAAKEASKVAEKAAKEASKAAKESEKDNKKAAKEAEKVEKEATKESEKAEKEASKTAKDAGKNSKSLKKVENYIFIGENQERIEVQIRTETKTKNGETYQKIKILGVEAVSELKLEKESSGKIKAELSNGLTKEIKLMPNTASKIALAKLQSQNRTLELKEVGKGKDSNIVYISEANKTIKFLGLFKSQYELTAMIDSETGEIIDLNGKPWWSFLAEEEIEEEIQTLALQLIQPLEDISILKDNNIILNLDDYFFNAKEYSLSESEFIALDLEDSKLTITPEENWTGSTSFSFTAINGEETLENSINVFVTEGNLSIQTTQYSAIVGENVKWKKEFKLTKKDKLNIKLPANSKNITLYKLDENKNVIEEETLNDIKININPKEDAYYALEYLTPEPQIFEDEISPKNKKIIVKGIDEAHYIDVIAFNYLETEAEADEIKLYRLGKNNRKEVSINKYDLNENGLIDYVEWIVPQLSDETYELIIEITKADHLDENKVFLSDIYDSVNALDDTWSELITNNHFVRITFENELTNKRDITVYSRADSTSSIEVYVKDSDEKVAEITGIKEEGRYKTYLDKLDGAHSDFDLKIISNSGIEFDYITDPATLLIVYPENTNYTQNIIELNYTITNAQECMYSLDEGVNNVTITCGDNVTSLTSTEGSNTWTIYVNSTDTGLWDVSDSVTFSVDTIFPTVDITYPLNANYSMDITYMNYTYSESNCDSVWYSVDGSSTNSSSVACGTNFTALTSTEGSNTWTVYINDTSGNENSTSITFFKDSIYPQISFESETAEDNSNLSQSNIYVDTSVTETNEDTITFLLYNLSEEVNSDSYMDLTRIINWTNLADGTYTYNVTINDTLGNSNTTETRTITLDTTVPVISFSCSDSTLTEGEILTCSCSATDNMDSNPTISYTANPSTSEVGTFTTSCSATDFIENSASSELSYTVSARAISRGQPKFRPTDNEIASGYEKSMYKDSKLYFNLEDEQHLFEVKDVTKTSAKISISSETQEATFSVGQEKKFEISGDNYYDIVVKLHSIDSTNKLYPKANFTLQTIHEEIVSQQPDKIKETPQSTETNETKEDKSKLVIFSIVLGIIILLIPVSMAHKKLIKSWTQKTKKYLQIIRSKTKL